ncbi:ribonucleotide-diphosphate reductase subunit beta [Leucothrix arctica]|uniref:ribonucleoside-diphosphate reductase n=1 Tax=Leucothrix arctica TaxID=1481894 RepID=A0A317CFM7_9GAMM|nr:ribonucleotide-diphosphate reductase subunit beta [Leucothrix arctica]PWQ97306.1 ribonucleotide-diphosphate reductase subunit beta [Leucothrix arctica]
MLNWDNPIAPKKPANNTGASATPAEKLATAFGNYSSSSVLSEESSVTSTPVAAKAAAAPEAPKPAVTPASEPVTESAVLGMEQEAEQLGVTGKIMTAVSSEDKRVINGQGDINQLAPFKYPWAWDYFLNANKNHWTPLDINMAQDVHDYNHTLTDAEKHVYENVLAYLTTSDIMAMRNIGLAVMEKMTAPELQIYQARQVYEEALHTWTYQHCIETLGIDQAEIYNRYRVVPEINQKIQLANRRLNDVMRSDMDLTNQDDLSSFVMSYMFFSGIFEGSWFYNGFTPIFSLQRRGLMKGTSEQLQYIMRDEVMHASFGIRVVKQILIENDVKLDPKEIRKMWDEAEAAEISYARYILREPILGYNADDHIEQFRFIANRRARQLGLEEPFPGAQNRSPWLDEQANMKKEKNFFETRVTEYQTGGALKWD